MMNQPYDPLYLEGIELFNAGEFYDCHDAWEALWTEYRGPSRRFYQGLIQAAVALYHLEGGNVRGARRMYHSSQAYLQDFRPAHQGLDLERFLTGFRSCFVELLECSENYGKFSLEAEARPRIELLPAGDSQS